MLSTNKLNCGKFGQIMTDKMSKIDTEFDNKIKARYPTAYEVIEKNNSSVDKLCKYLNWAHIVGVPLADQSTYDQLYLEVCTLYDLAKQEAYASLNVENEYVISQGIYAKLADVFESPEDNINYNTFQTLNTDILYSFANGIDADGDNYYLPAASNLVFELNTDGQVFAFLNDSQVTLEGCPEVSNCTVEDFVKTLRAKS